jgi:WD40 repeat protein
MDNMHVTGMTFNSAGSDLFVSSGPIVRRFNAKTGARVSEVRMDTKATLTHLSLEPDQGRAIGGGYYSPYSRELRLWNLATGEILGPPISDDKCDVEVVAFTGNPQWAISAGGYAFFPNGHCIFDLTRQARISGPVEGQRFPVTALAVSADERFFASGSEGGEVSIWSASSLNKAPLGTAVEPHHGRVNALAFTKAADSLTTVSADGTGRIWRVPVGQPFSENVLSQHRHLTSLVRFNWDGTLRFNDSGRPGIYLTDPRSGLAGGRISDGDAAFSPCIGYSPDGMEVVALQRGEIKRWEKATGRDMGPSLQSAPAGLSCVAYSADGQIIAAGDRDGAIHLWDAASGRRRFEPLRAHRGEVTTLRFSADNRYLLSGGVDGQLRMWNSKSGAAAGPVMPGSARVIAADIDPKNEFIAATYLDGGLRWWDVASGKPVGAPLPPDDEGIGPVMFTKDGAHVVASTGRYGLRRWPAPSQWTVILCSKITQDMSTNEWSQWISSTLPFVAPCGAMTPKQTGTSMAGR